MEPEVNKHSGQLTYTRFSPRTDEYQLFDSDLPIQIDKPAALKDEARMVKWDTGKISTRKVEMQHSDQKMVSTNCTLAMQHPLCQELKPRISNRRRNASNRYVLGVIVSAVTKADDKNEIKKGLVAETTNFLNPGKR